PRGPERPPRPGGGDRRAPQVLTGWRLRGRGTLWPRRPHGRGETLRQLHGRPRRRRDGSPDLQQLLLDPELAVRLHPDLLRDASPLRARAARGPDHSRGEGAGPGPRGRPRPDAARADRRPAGEPPPLPG